MKAPPAEKCPHCHGPVELVGMGRGRKPIKRCQSCGREPDTPVAVPISAPAFSDLAPGSAPRPCRVGGCPGTLDAAGHCACCEKRAAWEKAHRPTWTCDICEGVVRGKRKGNRRYCDACAPVAKIVAAAAWRDAKDEPRKDTPVRVA